MQPLRTEQTESGGLAMRPCIYHDKMARQIDEIHHMLTGNSNPEDGLFFQSKLNTAFRQRMEGFWVSAMNVMIAGGIVGCVWLVIVFYRNGFIPK